MKVYRVLFAALLLSGFLGLGTAFAVDDVEFEELINDSLYEEIDHS